MPILAMSAGTVTAVWGNAHIRLPDGTLKPVKVGDKVAGGAQIITEDDGIVQISRSKGAPQIVKAEAATAEADKTISAIDEQDTTLAPTAGLLGGAEGGLQAGLRVDRVDEHVSPLVFDFNTNRSPPTTPIGASVDLRPLPATPVDDRPFMLVQDGEPAVEGGPVVFNVTLTKASPSAVTVKLALMSGVDDPATPENESATMGVDTGTQLEYLDSSGQWVPVTGDLTFAPGTTLIQVRVATVDDALVEGVEFIKLQATVVSGDTVNQVHANQTAIVDNDLPYMLVQSGEPPVEGSPVVFDVVLTKASPSAVAIKLALMSGVDDPATPENESATVGVDTGTQLEYLDASGQWVPVTGDLTFAPGTTLIQVRVATVDDKIAEDVEYIKLQATVVSGDTMNQVHANQTAIVDNDLVPGIIEPIHAHVSAMDANLMIVLDTSASMSDPSGIGQLTRLQAAVQAIDHLLDSYDQSGDVAVRLVSFGSTAQSGADTWLTVDQAKSVLTTLQSAGNTNYDAALAQAQQAFGTTQGKLGNAQNIAYFLSDGNPTLSSANPIAGVNGQSGNTTQPNKGDGIDLAEAAAWVQFLNQNQIKAYAVGMGGDVSQIYLNPVAHDGQAGSNMDGLLVSDLAQLDGALSGTTSDFVQGNLSTGGAIGLPGGYFDRVTSITVDGISHPFDAAHPLLTLTTAHGGLLSVDMRTGDYSYAAPNAHVPGLVTETIVFSLLDQHAEVVSSTLNVTLDHTSVIAGTSGDDLLVGGNTANLIMGLDGADTIEGDGGHDQLLGGAGNDDLSGDVGDDLLVGGQGSDTLQGGAGSDVFAWHFDDRGASGSDAQRAVDTILDFDPTKSRANGGDVLDLRDLLQGENTLGGSGNLDHYLVFDTSGPNTVIRVAPTGDFVAGVGTESQRIILDGVNLRSDLGFDSGASDALVIAKLLVQGNLLAG